MDLSLKYILTSTALDMRNSSTTLRLGTLGKKRPVKIKEIYQYWLFPTQQLSHPYFKFCSSLPGMISFCFHIRVDPLMHWICLEMSPLCTLSSVAKVVVFLPTLPVSLADRLNACTMGRWGVSMKWSQECSSQTKRSSFHGKEAIGSNSCQFPNIFLLNERFHSIASSCFLRSWKFHLT